MLSPACGQFPADKAYLLEVIVVHTARGLGVPGNEQRPVVQYWSKDGDLLAEHDTKWRDPIWPAIEVRRLAALKLQGQVVPTLAGALSTFDGPESDAERVAGQGA